MKKFLKIAGLLLGILVVGIGILFFSLNEKEPPGVTGPEADQLAREMEQAVNKAAWDTTKYVLWTFRGEHDYVWDLARNFVRVSWGEKVVLLHTKTITGLAFINGKALEGDEKNKLIQQAWAFFCNDSFWLNPVVKAFDPGVQRSVVTLEDGQKALKVTYMEGGVTPGDSYLWILDENKRPVQWKMWVNIIPIGGLAFSWEDWQRLPSGAMVASLHKNKYLTLEITGIKGGMNEAEVGLGDDPFALLKEL
ncbi:MAG: hypothetical protein R2828_03350 [Saprospiraceae bacterium]